MADVPEYQQVRHAEISEPEGPDQAPHTWTHRLLPCLSLVLCDISLLLQLALQRQPLVFQVGLAVPFLINQRFVQVQRQRFFRAGSEIDSGEFSCAASAIQVSLTLLNLRHKICFRNTFILSITVIQAPVFNH